MKRVLLHVCCGICSAWAVEKLQNDGFQVSGFFYNPNIQPEEEYRKRLIAAQKVFELLKIELLVGDYLPGRWLEKVKGLEDELEGGKRCLVCFRSRLEEAKRKADELAIEHFTSTLSISPHKDFQVIREIGSSLSPAGFLAYDFKKENGFKKSSLFSREHQIYRQNYCGCLYSMIKAKT
jgi:predicted adenine nucleotide alpha hydrolase (AANH) superfamily ATPase